MKFYDSEFGGRQSDEGRVTRASVFESEVLVLELVAVNADAPRAVALPRVQPRQMALWVREAAGRLCRYCRPW